MKSQPRLWDIILLASSFLYSFIGAISFALTFYFSPVMLITLFLSFPFLLCTMKFSFHTVCHLGMAYELCISISPSSYTPLSLALSGLHLLTRFPSVLPPSSVNQRRSDKMPLLFVLILIPHRLLCTLVFFFLPIFSAWVMQSEILWLLM